MNVHDIVADFKRGNPSAAFDINPTDGDDTSTAQLTMTTGHQIGTKAEQGEKGWRVYSTIFNEGRKYLTTYGFYPATEEEAAAKIRELLVPLAAGKISTQEQRIQEVKQAVWNYLENWDKGYTLRESSLQAVAEEFTADAESNFESQDINPDELTVEQFVEDIEDSWDEFRINQRLILPLQKEEIYFTNQEHGIDATVTVWWRGSNLTDWNNRFGLSVQDDLPVTVQYSDGAWTVFYLAAVGFGASIVNAHFVDTPEEVVNNGSFTVSISVDRPKTDNDQESAEVIDSFEKNVDGHVTIEFEEE